MASSILDYSLKDRQIYTLANHMYPKALKMCSSFAFFSGRMWCLLVILQSSFIGRTLKITMVFIIHITGLANTHANFTFVE